MLNRFFREGSAGATAAQRRKYLSRVEQATRKTPAFRPAAGATARHSSRSTIGTVSEGPRFYASSQVGERPSSSSRYGDTNPDTGNSSLQERFDELVRRSILRYCPRDQDELRLSELFSLIKKEKPDFSVRVDADGVPLALLVKNCCYLQSHSGFLHFIRVAAAVPDNSNLSSTSSSSVDEADNNDPSNVDREDVDADRHQQHPQFKLRGEDLQKFKFRDLKHLGNGTQCGPEPWKFSASMMPFASAPRRRR